MILDTSFLIDVLRGSLDVKQLVDDLESRGALGVSSVTVMELWEGIHQSDSSAHERQAVEQLLTGLVEVPFDRECAMKAGELHAQLADEGNSIETADVMIAATGLVRDEAVVTRNVEHFERIAGLELETY